MDHLHGMCAIHWQCYENIEIKYKYEISRFILRYIKPWMIREYRQLIGNIPRRGRKRSEYYSFWWDVLKVNLIAIFLFVLKKNHCDTAALWHLRNATSLRSLSKSRYQVNEKALDSVWNITTHPPINPAWTENVCSYSVRILSLSY